MKARITLIHARWQAYKPHERALMLFLGIAVFAAMLWYGAYQPLLKMNSNSQQLIKRQLETLSWMRSEIAANHLPVKKIKTESVRNVVEVTASELHLSLSGIQQQGKTLSFTVPSVQFYDLKNWMRELNLASGARIEKIVITPTAQSQLVSADIKLGWGEL